MTWLPAILKGSICDTSALATLMAKGILRSKGQVEQAAKVRGHQCTPGKWVHTTVCKETRWFLFFALLQSAQCSFTGSENYTEGHTEASNPSEVRACIAGGVRRIHTCNSQECSYFSIHLCFIPRVTGSLY